MTQHTDVLIIGAGPAGLTASYLLTKEGRDVTVLERDPHLVGGISRTVNYKGFLFDIGGHRFFSKAKEVVDLWKEILPDDFIERPRISRIYYKGKLYSYPLKAFEALWNLGLVESALCMASYGWAKLQPVASPKTFRQWVRNAFGERLFSIFFKTYTEKVWGMSCDEISADWAAQRIKGLSLGAAVLNALGRSFKGRPRPKDGEVIKTLIESFQYPRKGPGMMWEAAARKTREQGGRILMDRTLSAMEWDEAARLWTVTARRGDGSVETFTANHVISSAPITELTAAIKPAPISLFHARALRYRDFLTVALVTTCKDLFPDNWIYIHDPSVKVGRIQNFRSWSPEMVPDPDLACLGLEYFCFEGDGLWSAPDAELIALAKQEIARIGLVRDDEVVDACVVRQAKAYPVYDDAYKDHVAMVRLDLEQRFPTLHLVGRNGMHKYNNQDHAMMTAMLTVRNILAGERLYDIWDVNEDAEYHEAGESGAREALGSERLVPRKVA
ncbi:FAD-dependent oxidoreductase [Alsobacter soli]|uniref:FAD-dependent oxidoreductase n=1 Tax=Alsobacter soli TaxID=2109933 RepID=A0A2T1HR45_9HYPH|nr:NAD(P)/FAD-dependent oxidoreductase [Alsobacter soli]PSC04092.1 FAD-dependent oxidoreductase [Alsobacter soli]